MAKRRRQKPPEQPLLIELPEATAPEPQVKPIHQPIWTENKAKLIERYLYYFVLVTKHGTYIDGFAGPQEPSKPETWAAKLVLESDPPWIRYFHLFEKDEKQFEQLKALKGQHAERDITLYKGDFNEKAVELLQSGSVKEAEATFCLLDHRTFECHWTTLEQLARHKKAGYKIELFYFLPNFWLDRALAAQKDTGVLMRWWGTDDWEQLRKKQGIDRAQILVDRFKKELGYQSAKPWPIYQRKEGGSIMYYMVHATDHPVAPGLMSRAYDKAVQPKESAEQLRLELGPLVEP